MANINLRLIAHKIFMDNNADANIEDSIEGVFGDNSDRFINYLKEYGDKNISFINLISFILYSNKFEEFIADFPESFQYIPIQDHQEYH